MRAAVIVVPLALALSARADELAPPPATGPAPAGTISIEIGTVRIAAVRANGRPWDTVVAGKKADPCDVTEAVPAFGKALSSICKLATDEGAKRVKHDESAPDIYVRIKAAGRTKTIYRTYTARNLYSHDFHSRFVVPLDAIPAGVDIQVLDDNGDATADEESIGEIHLGRARLAEITKQADPVLIEKDGSVEKIVLSITVDDPTNDMKQIDMNARDGMARVEGLTVDAGQVVEVCAQGRYQVQSGAWVDPSGDAEKSDRTLPVEPFNSARYGAAIALIGHSRMTTALIAAPCGQVVARSGGEIAVGINDRDPADNDGKIRFLVRVSDPTSTEWKTRAASRAPMPLPRAPRQISAEGWTTRAETLTRVSFDPNQPTVAEKLQPMAQKILSIIHPSGGGVALDSSTVARDGDQILVDFNLSWSGALLRHHTTVRWVFDRNKHISADVTSDSAVFNVAGGNKRALDEFFRGAYRALRVQLGE